MAVGATVNWLHQFLPALFCAHVFRNLDELCCSWWSSSSVIVCVLSQGDGVRERLSEQQYRRLVDYVTRASQFLSPSAACLQLQPPVTLAEAPPTVTKCYRYLVDPAFAKVFVSKFTTVKNKALHIGFH